jgi:hypothetical protein
MRSLVTFAAVLVLALAAGCGGGGGEEAEQAPATTQAPATSTGAPPASTEAPPTTSAPAGPATERVEITVAGGQAAGGIVRVTVDEGTRVVLEVTSDVADEAHLHGYDLQMPLTPGQPNTLSFVAKVPGRFELELHHAGTQIAELTVEP